ncbi:hypothetical protein AG1IA_04497 [Rhizoctonia solani AG-1 IA]|uniref:Uncharacterized protein n=1 Tax=Thanatephorus cucumeris (strain AG1-IA) TaxID=983506 RepID=L8WXC9_THACA|nr:hypothetical protein AG1IA_04497 [Rhizoctonia solani AG-1 IA]
MFRTVVIRATRSSLPRRVMLSAAPVLRPAVPVVQAQRFNSTRLHSAGPDWSAPVITYEELKPRTEQPKEVDCSRLDPLIRSSSAVCICRGFACPRRRVPQQAWVQETNSEPRDHRVLPQW